MSADYKREAKTVCRLRPRIVQAPAPCACTGHALSANLMAGD